MRLALSSLAIGLVLGACAKGGNGGIAADASVDEGRVDAADPPDDATRPDSHPPVDAAPPIDATLPIDAPMVDAAAPPDAMCTPVTTELLTNGPFDSTPAGTGWTQLPGDPAYPIITTTGVTADTPAYKAWLGGIDGDTEGTDEVDDVLYQDVVIPANTTSLVFTGRYIVGTQEPDPSDVYDYGAIGALDGATVVFVKNLDNSTITGTTWTAVSNTVTQNLSGKTIRIQAESTNDFFYPTNFFFDSLSLKATHCP